MIDVQVTGTREVSVLLDRMADRSRDLTPVMRDVADWMRDQWREAFDTSGRNLPRPWPALTQRTLAEKRHRGYELDVLVRRGDLRDSLTQKSHPMHIEQAGRDTLRIGSKSRPVPLLRHHGRDPIQAPRDLTPVALLIEQWIVDGDR